jgi:DUF1365 family protein
VTISSALYVGTVFHRRFKPKEHKLRYGVYWLLLDLDELSALSRSLRLFSRDRFNLFSFHERDYGARDGTPLREHVERAMTGVGLTPDGGAIRLLTMPRVLGYAFNPLSVYFCYGRDKALRAILYEVSNTFGQRHSYLVPVEDRASVSHSAPKRFYVSPFLDMDLTYAFWVRPPADRVSVSIHCNDLSGEVLAASLMGRRRAITDAALAKVFFTHPLLTLKVMAGIHWEALRLWLKGVGLRNRPPPPERPITVVAPHP